MKTFKNFLNENKSLLLCGGNAVKDPRISRINQDNVEATMNDIYSKVLPLLKITKKDVGSLGSTGKKLPGGSSGDVDLAVDIHAVLRNNKNINDVDELFDKLVDIAKTLKMGYKDMRQMGLVSIGFPIHNTDGKQEGKLVQLDFMPTESLEYSKWAYYSPAEWESKWKGLYANEIMFFLAKHIGFKPIKTTQNGEPIEYERYFFDLSKGLLKGIQSKQGKRGILKNAKTLSKNFVSNDPKDIIKLLIGPKVDFQRIRRFETLLKVLENDKLNIHSNIRHKVYKDAIAGIKKKGYPVPDQLQKLV